MTKAHQNPYKCLKNSETIVNLCKVIPNTVVCRSYDMMSNSDSCLFGIPIEDVAPSNMQKQYIEKAKQLTLLMLNISFHSMPNGCALLYTACKNSEKKVSDFFLLVLFHYIVSDSYIFKSWIGTEGVCIIYMKVNSSIQSMVNDERVLKKKLFFFCSTKRQGRIR